MDWETKDTVSLLPSFTSFSADGEKSPTHNPSVKVTDGVHGEHAPRVNLTLVRILIYMKKAHEQVMAKSWTVWTVQRGDGEERHQ